MISAIIQYIGRHTGAALFMVSIWLGGAWLLHEYGRLLWAELDRLKAVGTDGPKALPEQEDIDRARGYLRKAQQRIRDSGVDLSLMERACSLLPLRFEEDLNIFKPHWLDRLRHWRISGQRPEAGEALSTGLAEPLDYWKKNRTVVYQSLEELAVAMQSAFEIPPPQPPQQQEREREQGGAPGKASGERVLLPQLFARYATALCQPALALLVWGEWAQFLEAQFEAQFEERGRTGAASGEKLEIDRIESASLARLRRDADWIKALKNYLGGAAPDPYSPKGCLRQSKLSCFAPREALTVYHKLLSATEAKEAPAIYLNMAKTELWLARSKAGDQEDRHQSALRLLYKAAESPLHEGEARLLIARIYLERRNYRYAMAELQRLAALQPRGSVDRQELRRSWVGALRGLGRFQDADCLAEQVELPYGRDPHCLTVRY